MASNHQVFVKVDIRNLWVIGVFVALLVISFHVSGAECYVVHEGSDRGDWPFIVIVKEIESSDLLCHGTVISPKHILVDAACSYSNSKKRTYSPEDVVVHLGAFSLLSTNEEGVVRVNVTKMHIHPDWDRNAMSDDANLAIFVLSDDITFTDSIQPVRLPAADDVAINSSTVDVVGTAAGWSIFTKDMIMTQATVRALNCDRMKLSVASYKSDRIFCSEYVNNGGFFVRTDDTWVQYGSLFAFVWDPSYPVGRDHVAVYTNIKLFTNWIAETVKKN